MSPTAVETLRCPQCFGRLLQGKDSLRCNACAATFPIERGVPRFAQERGDAAAERTRRSFGYEWSHFSDWEPSGTQNFAQYFGDVDLSRLRAALVLDAGCGMGRHARQMAAHARHLFAVDFSSAIDAAARNTAGLSNVDCVQADLFRLPFADETFDYVYSLGVLHHVRDTPAAVRLLASKVKPGGRLRIYLYWKRHGWQGALLRVVSAVRVVTTRLPLPLLRLLCAMLSVVLYGGVIQPYRLLRPMGFDGAGRLPLWVYVNYPFAVLYNDQFDRLSAPIEKRYDADDVRRLMESAGLTDLTVRPSFGWVAEGVRPQ